MYTLVVIYFGPITYNGPRKLELDQLSGWPSKEKRKELKSLLLHPSVWESESLLEEVCFYWQMLTISLLAERIEHTTFFSFLTIQPTLYLFLVAYLIIQRKI